MPSNQTANYSLSQWVKSDQVRMEDFNADNAKLDAALAEHAGSLSRLSGQVAGKAEQTALTAEANARKSAVTALNQQLALKGNCQMEILTYTGNGLIGAGNPTRIPFTRPPDWFIILGGGYLVMETRGSKSAVAMGSQFKTVQASWSGSQLSLVSDNPSTQMCVSNARYLALGLHMLE